MTVNRAENGDVLITAHRMLMFEPALEGTMKNEKPRERIVFVRFSYNLNVEHACGLAGTELKEIDGRAERVLR